MACPNHHNHKLEFIHLPNGMMRLDVDGIQGARTIYQSVAKGVAPKDGCIFLAMSAYFTGTERIFLVTEEVEEFNVQDHTLGVPRG